MSQNDPLFKVSAGRNAQSQQEPCPVCAEPLVIKHIGSRSFWGCSRYPMCDYTRSLHEEVAFTPQSLPGKSCPLCSKPLLLKKGRYGFFIGCSGFPQCDYMTDPEPDSEQPLAPCPVCKQGHLVERSNKYGKHFYPCDRYPQCKFALNNRPVEQPCPTCNYPLLVEKRSTAGQRLVCPEKSCSYKSELL